MEPSVQISLAAWSLHRRFWARDLDPLDLARKAHETFGLSGVEHASRFFPDRATDFGYLAEMKKRADDAGVKSVLVKVEESGALGAGDAPERFTAIDRHFPWIVAAAFLGCDWVSVAAEGTGVGAPYLDAMAESLWRLGTIADDYGIGVLVGNRFGLSCDGSWMKALLAKTAHPRVAMQLNADNFDLGGGKVYPRDRGLEEMMPLAKALTARSYAFDARGDEPTVDYAHVAQLAGAATFSGWVGVEYDGPSLPEEEGVAKTVALLRRIWPG
jgi:L-ribulose-5-phosphate 3-epimerase